MLTLSSLLKLREQSLAAAPALVRQYATAKPGSFSLGSFSSTRTDFPRHPAASEVSSILESRIAGTSLNADVQETGRVLSMLLA
jgi:F-type H+-transporting ATPase subunit alpha